MGIAVILCALVGLIPSSALAGDDSHISLPQSAFHPVTPEMMPPLPPTLAADTGPAQRALLMAADYLGLAMVLLAPVLLILLWHFDVIRPGSMHRRGIRDVTAWPWWFWLLCAIATYITAGIGAGLGVALADAALTDPEDIVLSAFMTVAASIFGIAAGIFFLFILRERTPSPRRSGIAIGLDIRGISLGLIAIAIALPVVQFASFASVLLYRITTGDDPDAIAHDTLVALYDQPGHPAVWALIFGAVIGAPILEEFVFRVYLQSSLVRLFGGVRGGVWAAILISSIIFTAVHIGAGIAAGQWHALIAIFVLGAAMGIAYEHTRRAIVPILMHMVFNAFNIALVLLAAS